MAWHDFHYVIHGRDVRLVPQLDGSPHGGENCACATAAMHILSECQGRYPGHGNPWPPTGASFRIDSHDTVGGLLASTVDETSNREYGIDPDFQIATGERVTAKLRAGYGATFLHDYSPISAAGKSGSPGFGGNHGSFLADIQGAYNAIQILTADPLYDGRRAGIPIGPQWINWRTIVRAAELLDIGSGRLIDRYGAGMLYVGFTRVPYRPTAPVLRIRYSVAFGGGSFYTYNVANGVIVPAHPRDAHQFSAPTSAPCGPPRTYTWAGQTPRRLVRISNGQLADEYVAVPQGTVRLVEKEIRA